LNGANPERLLPAGLYHAGNHTRQGHFSETNPAQSEAAKVSPLPPATPAAIICPRFILGLFIAFFDHCFSSHERISSVSCFSTF